MARRRFQDGEAVGLNDGRIREIIALSEPVQ
jgi:hypothetical protein